ncbi:MAG: FAD-dependent oxidoreductase [Bacteroidetes bacterium]|nr:FAD-dependent oxidoreductase [Bacteroidota bacterium]MCW5896123.1 FAD-dependent oxidoreductase [Bacteroidota bacterium]
MPKRIVVIGGVAAGPSAAAKAKRTNADCDVVLFEQNEHISYGVCEIPYYIGGDVEGNRLVSNTPAQLREKKGVEVRILHRVEEILPTRKRIIIRDLSLGKLREEAYDRLILATGSRPKRLGVEGEEARNVFSVKKLEDAYRLYEFIKSEKPKHAVIIGGGYIGMEMAEALRSRSLDVTILHRHNLPMHGLERETQEEVLRELAMNNVQFIGEAKTEGCVVDTRKRVSHVVTKDGSFQTDLVILALGVVPNSEIAQKAGIRVGTTGGIRTDQRQETNLDNIYAAGDCCEVRNLVSDKPAYMPLATIGSKQGWVAGENAAGGNASFRGAVRSIAVKVFGLEVARVGLSSEEARASGFDVITESVSAWSKVAMMPGSAKVSITMIADRRTKRLLGVNMIGSDGVVLRVNTFAVAIQNKMSIPDIQQWDLAYSPPFTPLWDPILVAANATARKLGNP